jgi:UTP-glucose-1-phosphate uridylyltransferase
MPNGEIIEKPRHPQSNIVAAGRYLLTPEIFDLIGKENCMADALNKLNPKQIVITSAVRFDTGSRRGYYDAFYYATK